MNTAAKLAKQTLTECNNNATLALEANAKMIDDAVKTNDKDALFLLMNVRAILAWKSAGY
jgi:hypothetical protein